MNLEYEEDDAGGQVESNGGPFVRWYIGNDYLTLDGMFSADQLMTLAAMLYSQEDRPPR